jgi:hypothetical protein
MAVLHAGASPATADAAYLSNFRVRDGGDYITWAVSVCTRGRTRVHRFRAYLEVVRIVVELRDGDPVSELSQTGVAATSGTAVGRVV